MDVFEAIYSRRSIRKFTGGAVEHSALEKMVDAGRLAPSGSNQQPWEFIVVTDPIILSKICVPADHWLSKSGAVIALVMDPVSRWWVEDGSAAIENMLLACTALGYGACWIEGYTLRNEETIRGELRIPREKKLFALIAVGVPDEQPTKEKKELSEVLHWQHY